jgi:hypothetical protein
MLEVFKTNQQVRSMYSIEESIVAVYCCVDEGLKLLTPGCSSRSRGFEPKLSDAEVLTMEIVAEFQGIDQDKAIWQYFRRHWQAWFPQLSSRSSFVRHSANLWQYKQRLEQHLAATLGAVEDNIHLIDGLPMRLCCLTYAPRCQSFRGGADYGYCAAKDEHFYGFRVHLHLSFNGVISD